METENTEVEIVEVEETSEAPEMPAQVVLDAEQYESIVGALVQTRYEVQKSNERLHSVWFLLAIMVLFESRRVVNGISQKIRKVRKV